MCVNCGYSPCSCESDSGYSFSWCNNNEDETLCTGDGNVSPESLYEYNWCTTNDDEECDTTTVVCRSLQNAICVQYKGPNLDAIGLTTNVNLELILANINSTLNTIIDNGGSGSIEDIIESINNLTQRLNALEAEDLIAF